MQREDILKLGAQAARDGLTFWDCPYYRAAAMPGHTGESIAEWHNKVQAWEAGWREACGACQPLTESHFLFGPCALAHLSN